MRMCPAFRWGRTIAFFALLVPVLGSANEPWCLGARVHRGFLWPHRPASWVLVEGHATGFELFAEHELHGEQGWQRDYRGPAYGFAFLWADMDNPRRIGGVCRLVPYLHLPMVRGERTALGMRLGWGLGHVARPYDRLANNKQIAIGTRINTAIQIMLEGRHRIGRTQLSVGLSIDHWSNGSFKLPNLGLNLLSLNAGASYALGQVTPYTVPKDSTVHLPSPRRETTLAGAFGVNETGRPLSGQHSVAVVIGQVQWRVSPKSSVAVGVDLFNKGSLVALRPELAGRSRPELTQLGLHGGYALGFGRAELMLQMGTYVHTPAPDESAVFHRLGMRYRVARHWIAHLALKSHFGVADHWEFGFGYRWG
jgi:hypothetical protein